MDIKKQYYNISEIPKKTELTERIMVPHSELNYCLNGLLCERVSCLIAPTDSGKSCFMQGLIVSAIKQGYKAFLFDGENDEQEARDAIYRQYLEYDKENFEYKTYVQNGKQTNTGEYILKESKYNEIDKIFANRLFIYNNELPATKKALIGCLQNSLNNEGWKFAVIDNAEMFDLEETNNENRANAEIWKALRLFAQVNKVHILIICHIKKTERDIIRPTIFDAKGTSSATNIAKNILSLIRLDCVDKTTKEYKSLARVVELNGYNIEECSAIVEILKTKGRKRELIGYKFNRISNSYYEAKKVNNEKSTEPILYDNTKSAENTKSKGFYENATEIIGEDLPF